MCWLFGHNWFYPSTKKRHCLRCKLRQVLTKVDWWLTWKDEEPPKARKPPAQKQRGKYGRQAV